MTMGQTGQSRFWQITALAALLLCAFTIFSRGGPAANADNGGASMDGVIAMMGNNTANDHLYLIDTRTKNILMYESRGGNNFMLVAGRNYDPDMLCLTHATNKEMPYEAKGYPTAKIQAAIQQIQAANTQRP
jgi:hypothetical protein